MAAVLHASARRSNKGRFCRAEAFIRNNNAANRLTASWSAIKKQENEKNVRHPEVCSGVSLSGLRVVDLNVLAEALDGGCEACGQQQPSITAKDIQKKLVHNHVCLTENCPSKASLTRVVREDICYSYERLNVVARESLTQDTERRLVQYLDVCSTLDSTSMHFFDEYSVVKTTGNRTYGHSQIGSPAVEIQRYASNATFTVNLLHSIFGVSHVNVINGPSNGLELLNFFAEALEEKDVLDNPVLKDGDTVIMDNCGFHHARHVEPVLRNMLTRRGCNLLFQPLYHPVFNTCEYCFRVMKGWLHKTTELTENHTLVAIYDALSRTTPGMSRNFFRHCGYIA
ncbi:uncharacterized protein [Montipora capricornis]|uniref:uncharacterized protein n=1 Tax=Montipora capricornis TaxID=246305 RepID=UPI0035F21582